MKKSFRYRRQQKRRRTRVLRAEPLEDRRLLAALTFSTSDNQFDAGIDNQGWWSNLDSNFDSNANYIVGNLSGGEYRNFFTFDLSTLDLSSENVVSATLRLRRYIARSNEATETFRLFDVSTPAATLNNNRGRNSTIFNDLGTGTSYGSFSVRTSGSTTDVLNFDLNSAALTDITQAAGGFFSIGGTSPSADSRDEYLFGFSTGVGIQELVILTEESNEAPTAADDSYAVDEDNELLVSASGVLGNDSDPNGDDLKASVLTTPSDGDLTLNSDGSFTYTPDENFNGTDSFTYEACDTSNACDDATVEITVNSVNDAPVAGDDSYEVDEDNELDGSSVLDNDDDSHGGAPSEDNTPLRAELVTDVSNGTLVLDSDGTFTYTPDENFNGTDSFTYEAVDSLSGVSEVATVEITVHSVIDALIDVKPGNGDEVDPINLGSKGKTPIAILATQQSEGEVDDFDPTAVDEAIATFAINGVAITPDKITIEDVDGDGDDDWLLHFLTEDLADILTEDDDELVLTAEFDGDALGDDLGGSDAIKIVPKKGKKK